MIEKEDGGWFFHNLFSTHFDIFPLFDVNLVNYVIL